MASSVARGRIVVMLAINVHPMRVVAVMPFHDRCPMTEIQARQSRRHRAPDGQQYGND
jgi:hypothetical protein